jgi:hypothetical protein
MGVIPSIGSLVLPANISPGSPATYEFVVDTFSQLAESYPASGLTAHGAAISNATTNTAIMTIPAANVSAAVAGSCFVMRCWGIVSSPASSAATLAWNTYSGGSGGTALTTGSQGAFDAFQPTASLSSALFDVEAVVNFYSTTTVQCIQVARISSSTSTSAANSYLAGNNSATPVTVTANTGLTINLVMGSAVSGSTYEAVGGYWNQVA